MKAPARIAMLATAALALVAAGAEPAWQVELTARLRVESREQNFTFDDAIASPTDDSWLLSRVRVGLKGPLSPALGASLQLQDAREFGSARPSVPYVLGSEGDDPMDVRQAYLEWKHGDVAARVGRQALALGDERLVGPLEWNNFGRTFDAARLTFPKAGGGLDVFGGSVVRIQPGSKGGWRANHSSARDLFAGVYGRFGGKPQLKMEPYVFWRRSTDDVVYSAVGAGTARPYDIPQKVLTAGVRLHGGAADRSRGFDYDADLALQTGRARGRQPVAGALLHPGPAWLDHRAWAAHAGIGYSATSAGVPWRFYVEANRASGDRNPADGRTESFLNLFPTNHKFYGGMDAFAWKNLREIAVSAATTIGGTKLRVEHHWFALDNVNDTWFRANAVTPVRPLSAAARRAPREAGTEIDVVVSRAVGKKVSIEGGYSYFGAGRYLAATGGSAHARFVYLQTSFQW